MTDTNADRWVSAAHRPLGLLEFVLIISGMIAVNPLALDLMLPAQPALAEAFGITNANRIQMVLSIYMLGFGVGQIVIGPMSDRFGRRPVVITGFTIFGLASLFSIAAESFATLLVARALQGLGSAGTRVIATSIVRDCYTGRRMASVMSLVQMVFIAVPIVAPSLGQLLLLANPRWQVIFIAILLYGLLLLIWSAARLPETLAPDRRKLLTAAQVLSYYRRAITTRQTIGYALAAGAIQGAMFSYIFSAQQIFAEHFDLGRYFPLAFGTSAIGFLAAGFVNARAVERFGMRVMSHGALVLVCAISSVLLLAAIGSKASLPLYLAVACCMTFGFGLTFANFTALAMEPQGEIAGTASSVFGSITVLCGFAIGSVVGQVYDGTIMPIASGFFLCTLGSLLIVFITEGGRLFRTRNKPV